MVAAGQPLGEILAALCLLAEAQLPGAKCSILLHDPDGGLLRHGTAPRQACPPPTILPSTA
jgi:hypothetical protein